MSNRIQFRRDTAARWTSINPILQEGELGIETDTRFTKVGDGVHAWNDLEYATAVHNITHSLGTSENLVMSQKGVKAAIDKIVSDEQTAHDVLETKLDNFIASSGALFPYEGSLPSTGVTVQQASIETEGGYIYFNPSTKSFVYEVGGKYYNNWSTKNSGIGYQYNSVDNDVLKARTDRLFILQDKLYFFDGNTLSPIRDYISQQRGQDTEISMSQKAITDGFTEIEKEIWPLATNFRIEPSSAEYTGNPQNVTIFWNLMRRSQTIENSKISSLIITVDEDDEYNKTTASGSMVVPINNLGNTIIEISAYTTDGLYDGEGKSYVQYLPIYCGFATDSIPNITSLTKYSKQTANGNYTLTNDTTGKYLWICIPDNLTINKVTLNGFDVPMNEVILGTTPLGNYKCYRSANALEAKTFTFKVE